MKWIIFTFIVLLTSCNSFYGTNHHDYLNLTFDSSKINEAFLQRYVDSVLNKSTRFPDSIKSQFYISDAQKDIYENQRIIHFRESPEEWYLIGLEINPCWIEAVYNTQLNHDAIFTNSFLKSDEIGRIKNRFQKEILDSLKLYAKENHISDSIVYINR